MSGVLETVETIPYKILTQNNMHVLTAKNINKHIEKINTEAPCLLGCETVSLGVAPHTFKAHGNFIFKIKHSQFLLGRLTPRMRTLQSFHLLT
jgi:hypothetical protein